MPTVHHAKMGILSELAFYCVKMLANIAHHYVFWQPFSLQTEHKDRKIST